MAVRFVLGRAGSGKTFHCLEAIRQELHADPVNGPRLVLLVPEQASFQTERALVVGRSATDGLGVIHRAEVLSFRRLAYRILDHVGAAPRTLLSTASRAMVLRHLLSQLAGQLVYYRRVERFNGFLEKLGSTLQELIDEAIEPSQLLAHGQPSAESAKLADLALIYRAYLDYLGDQRIDPSQYLELARRSLPSCAWLKGARIWVDGFAGFTRLERLTLLDLAVRAADLTMTVLVDPASLRRDGPPEPWDLFAKTLRTHDQLCRLLHEHGLAIESPLVLRPSPLPRFVGSPSLAAMERRLFSDVEPDIPKEARPVSASAPPTTLWDFVPTLEPASAEPDHSSAAAVEIVELPTRRLETEYAVARLCDAVRESGGKLRYRDTAIIVRELQPYSDLLTAALADRSVPYFIDRRRSVAHHPLVELLRSLCLMAAESLSLESVRLALKTDLLGIPREAADELENYLLAHGIEGTESWLQEWSFASRKFEPLSAAINTRVNRARVELVGRLENWLSSTARSGEEWAEALRAVLDRLDAAAAVEGWAAAAEGVGDLDQASEHRQVWRDVQQFVDELAAVLGQTPLSVSELASIVDAGLAQLTLGLTPPMLDQVLVGAIERSRHPELKLVILLGFNDGVFPRAAVEDTILNDDDRAALIASGAEVAPPRRQAAMDESLLAYVAFTRASERLIVTYAAADESGKALRPSPYVEALSAACGGVLVTRCGEPFRQRATWPIQTARDLAAGLAGEFRQRRSDEADESSRRLWNALYERVRTDEELSSRLRPALCGLDEQRQRTLSEGAVKLLFQQPSSSGGTPAVASLTSSVSRLESFAACPFKHFAHYALKLRERELAELEPIDVGTVHHAILEDFMGQFVESGPRLHELSDSALAEALDASCERVAKALPATGVLSRAREAYLLRRGRSELRRVIEAQQRVSGGGRFRPRGMEVKFGPDRSAKLPALEITTPRGRKLMLQGAIDRVDLAELTDEMLGIVVDYKRTLDKRLDLSAVYHGLSLQLVAYLLALADRGTSLAGRPIRPVGAFYVSIMPRYTLLEHPDDCDATALLTSGPHRPRGILRADAIEQLDEHCPAEGRSSLYSVFFKKSDGESSRGDVGHIDSSDAAEAESFDALLAATRAKLGDLADRVLDGDIDVAPYRLKNTSPCTWCAFGAVCRFEYGQEGMRFLEALKRSEVFQLIRGPTARPT